MPAERPKTLRLILGDQLNQKHSWFRGEQQHILYHMAEMRQETDFVKHHIQKVVAFFSAMRSFRKWLEARGIKIVYHALDAEANSQDLAKNLQQLIQEHDIEQFEYQLPDEYRLDQQLKDFCAGQKITTKVFDTEHFLSERDAVEKFFAGKKRLTMEYFYREMRRRYQILLDADGQPEGGQWNYDQSNRKAWEPSASRPRQKGFRKDVSALVRMLEQEGVETFGRIDPTNFSWPTTRRQGLALLNHFCRELLPHFGDYQDAMHSQEVFLFHSRLSFVLNSKLLSPQEVMEKAIGQGRKNQDQIDISQVEGFVRQILGWREFMRGVYWQQMPGYRRRNALRNSRDLPAFYWTGETGMNCLRQVIKNSLDHAYAHHIQRLMVAGNFALLMQVHPDQVDQWYLGVYIDAIEWVELPNTRGMSQWADGGLVATKPYVSSGNYIQKMSNYCQDCRYQVSKKTEDEACPFNALYWNFLAEKRDHFAKNQRMTMMLSLLDKKSSAELQALRTRARWILNHPDKL